ncbi:MAG: glycosyltransferase family 4 protein [Chloroflexota bacterium]
MRRRNPIPGIPTGHVVFVCLAFHPDTAASSMLFTDLFRGLTQKSLQVTVLCGFPSKDGLDTVKHLPRCEVFDGIHIVRCGLRLRGKRNLATRALAYGSFLVHAGWKLLKTEGTPTILGGTDPPFTAAALWIFSRLRPLAYECIVLDLYPDGLVALGALSGSSYVTRLWRWFNVKGYRRASRIFVIARDSVGLLQSRYGVDPSKVVYIPHWGTTEVEELSPEERGPLITQLGLQEKFVVQYSGNMGLWHDIETFVRAANIVRDDDRVHFVFIGKGMRRTGAESLARSLGLNNMTWMDFLPRDELPKSLVSCDAALVSLRAGLEGIAVPSKLYGILAAGRAVIAQVPPHSEVAYAVEEAHCGIVVPPGDPEALADAIIRLADDPGLVQDMGRCARHAYLSRYTIEHAVDAYLGAWGRSPHEETAVQAYSLHDVAVPST